LLDFGWLYFLPWLNFKIYYKDTEYLHEKIA
jgi:hypothetical protein